MDSSSNIIHRGLLRQKLRVADCILALYDVTRLETLDSLHQEWLPFIRDFHLSSHEETITGDETLDLKVIVVGTKTDLLGESMGTEDIRRVDERDRLSALFHEFHPIIRSCDRCSAKLLHVDNVFYNGELVVTFPVEPLYDKKNDLYTPDCSKALKRIFRIVDVDRDGLLSNHELNQLEIVCFNHTLKDVEIEVIKRRLYHTTNGSFEDGKLTMGGFFGLMHLFIDRSIPQIPWATLKHFGFDEKLFLKDLPKSLQAYTSDDFKVHRRRCSVELSLNAENFLMALMDYTIKNDMDESTVTYEISSFVIEEIFSVLSEDQRKFWTSGFLSIDLPQLDLLCGVQSEDLRGTPLVLLELRNFTSHHAFLSQFQVLATIYPYHVKVLLYQLGFAEQSDLGLSYRTSPNEGFSVNSLQDTRRVLHIAVICPTWKIVDLIHGNTLYYRDPQYMHRLSSSGCSQFINGKLYYFVFTEISIDALKSTGDNCTSFDIILLQFEPSLISDLEYLRNRSQLLPELPRMFVVSNRGNNKCEEEIRDARIYVKSVELTKLFVLEENGPDTVNADEVLYEMCMEIVDLLVDTGQRVPLSSRPSYPLSTTNIMSLLIPPFFITIGIIFSAYKLNDLRVSIKKCLKYVS